MHVEKGAAGEAALAKRIRHVALGDADDQSMIILDWPLHAAARAAERPEVDDVARAPERRMRIARADCGCSARPAKIADAIRAGIGSCHRLGVVCDVRRLPWLAGGGLRTEYAQY